MVAIVQPLFAQNMLGVKWDDRRGLRLRLSNGRCPHRRILAPKGPTSYWKAQRMKLNSSCACYGISSLHRSTNFADSSDRAEPLNLDRAMRLALATFRLGLKVVNTQTVDVSLREYARKRWGQDGGLTC